MPEAKQTHTLEPLVVDAGVELLSESRRHIATARLVAFSGSDAVLEAKANAARLALCWNSHDCLLAACVDALETNEGDLQHILDNGRLREVLRAAIAKATA